VPRCCNGSVEIPPRTFRPVPLTSGTRLGTYEIVAPLGAGGMGEVYRARDLRLGREIALKVLPAEVAGDPERLARFERQARTVAGRNHPNIVVLHSVEDEDGIRFLTMELVEGQSLSELVAPGGLPLAKLLDLAIPLADALVAAHERGVIHRDLKPGNVMVTRDGRVKVLDFGLAKFASGDVSDATNSLAITMESPISTEGQVVGTVPYMAPEQIRGETLDARSDLFALGVMLYELAAGRRPFNGPTPADVSSAILRDAPEPLGRIRVDLPGDLERIVGRCLEKNPRERFQTVLDVSNELRRLRRLLHRGAHEPASREATSIAVLPFVNRSRDEEDEYFSDGLADELLHMLAKIRGLRVAARSSAFHFKGKDTTIAEVGKALNVATVLEGSVRKAGNRVRISVQLVKVSDGYHLWSETYDRTIEDIFAVQDDIAQSVVKELRTTLLGEAADSEASGQARAEVARAAKGRSKDPEAHRLYLLARHLIDRMNRGDMAKAIEYLTDALDRDPGFALAWSDLGRALMRQAGVGWIPVTEGFRRAREAVERGLALDPDMAEGHAHLAWIQIYHDRDWRGAEASFARALELAPGNAEVLSGAGTLAYDLGNLDQAIVYAHRALEQDPLSSATYNRLGLALFRAERPVEAEAALRKALELAPQRGGTRAILSQVLLAQGRGEEAVAMAKSEPENWAGLSALAIVEDALGHRKESDQALEELIAERAEDAALQIAEVCGARGEADAAFDWLERAYEQADPGLSEMKTSPSFRSLQDDPRWRPFLERMGFGE